MADAGKRDAGVGAATPASSSAEPSRTGPDIVEEAARVELERIRRRWDELPVQRAAAAAPGLRQVLEELATRTAPGAALPDLGPGALADQLAVLVWDAYARGRGDGIAERLTTVRRALP